MKVITLVLNADGEPHFKSEDQVNFEALVEMAKDRESAARGRGARFVADAITFLGGQVVSAVNTGEHRDVMKAIYEMLMASWTFDSLFGGVSFAKYQESDLTFTVAADGIVTRTFVDPMSEELVCVGYTAAMQGFKH